MHNNISQEKKVLSVSAFAAVAFAITGIVLGLITGSQIILFDGLYSLISVALSVFSVLATSFIGKKDYKRYPFGKDIIEPLVIILKYSIILILVVASFAGALTSILKGGRDVAIGYALLYSGIGSFACLAAYLYLNAKVKKSGSGLVKAEASQWFMDTLVSFAVLFGFVIASLIDNYSHYTGLVPYVDPIMMIIISLYFLKLPLSGIRSAAREVLEMTPSGKLPNNIKKYVRNMEIKYDMKESFVRIAKVGKTLWVEIDFVVQDSKKIKTVADQDKLRQELSDYIKTYNKNEWLTVSFTNNRKWAV